MLITLAETAVVHPLNKDAFQSFLIIAGVFGAVANIGIVFYFISKVDSTGKQNSKDIAEMKIEHAKVEERVTTLQIELARLSGAGRLP